MPLALNTGFYLVSGHFILALIIGYAAKKYFERSFILWFTIGFLVPIVSAVLLFILGYDGIYCPNCGKKIKKSAEKCPHCQFEVKKFLEEDSRRREAMKKIFKKDKKKG